MLWNLAARARIRSRESHKEHAAACKPDTQEARGIDEPNALLKESDAGSKNEEPFDNITATAPPTRTVTRDKLAEAFAHGFTAAADLAADGKQLECFDDELYTEDEPYGDEEGQYAEDEDVLDAGSENEEPLGNITAISPPTRTATTEGLAECFAQIMRANADGDLD